MRRAEPKPKITLEQFVERFPHLQIEHLRFLDWMDRNGEFGTLWAAMAELNCEETLVMGIDMAREFIHK